MMKDAKDYVNLCDKCQRHRDMHIAPPVELTSILSPWPFAWWGIDLLGPFPKVVGKLKYLVVAIDYSTNWIETEVSALVISDNGTQFTDHKFQYYLRKTGIKQSFTSVEHPQANGLAEATKSVIVVGRKNFIRSFGHIEQPHTLQLASHLFESRMERSGHSH